MITKNISRTSKVKSAFPPGPSFTNHNQSTLKVRKALDYPPGPGKTNHNETILKIHKGLGANHNETIIKICK